MPLRWSQIPAVVLALVRRGTVVAAHPLVLDSHRRLDERWQRALSPSYFDAGVGGLAVGVHTTPFTIRNHELYETVLKLPAAGCSTTSTIHSWPATKTALSNIHPRNPAAAAPHSPVSSKSSLSSSTAWTSSRCGQTTRS
jgi:hypothetical protein